MATVAQHVRTTIRYDGPDLVGHEMDVRELAPALLALADMIQRANQKFNGDAATMTVKVRADVEQKCFMLEIHIVQSLIEAARHLFTADSLKSAKEIAEYLDLIVPGGLAGGVWWLLQRAYGDKSKEEAKPLSSYETEQRGGVTIIQNFYGPGQPLEVKSEVYELATDPEIVASSKEVLAPLGKPGYESVGFYEQDAPVIEVREEQARRIIDHAPSDPADAAEAEDADMGKPSHVDGQVKIKTAVYEGDAQWDLWWTGRTRKMKMEHKEWVDAFQRRQINAPPGSWLDVHMVIAPPKEPGGQASYTVTEVKRVIPPDEDGELFDDDA